MVRMFLLGTLVPLVSLDSAARDVFQSLVSIIDLFGIYYAVNQTVGKPEIKVSYKWNQYRIFWRDYSRSYRSWLAGAWQRVSYQHFWSIGMVPVNTNSLGNISTFRLIKILISFNSLQQLFWFGFGQDKVFFYLWKRMKSIYILDLSPNMVPVVSSVLLMSLLKGFFVKVLFGGSALMGNILATAIITTFSFSLFLSITAH